MKLKSIYKKVIDKGVDADVRTKKEINDLLKKKKSRYENLSKKEKEYFDRDTLINPYADTRILNGDPETNIESAIVGVDVGPGELVLVDRLNQRGEKIDLVISHHPQGRAYAQFYDVMDLQVDVFSSQGISISACENLLSERKQQVARRVSAANHARGVDAARLLGLNFLCMHTPCDNLAYRHLEGEIKKAKPNTLGDLMDVLYGIDEYKEAAKINNPPIIAIGNKNSRCSNIHLEFTGGTEGPKGIYQQLSAKGIDTIVAMHQSEEHFKECKKHNINVIFASHIASDNIGLNRMLDYIGKTEKLKIYEFSGFTRIKRKVK